MPLGPGKPGNPFGPGLPDNPPTTKYVKASILLKDDILKHIRSPGIPGRPVLWQRKEFY